MRTRRLSRWPWPLRVFRSWLKKEDGNEGIRDSVLECSGNDGALVAGGIPAGGHSRRLFAAGMGGQDHGSVSWLAGCPECGSHRRAASNLFLWGAAFDGGASQGGRGKGRGGGLSNFHAADRG